MALANGKKLTIGDCERVYDDTGRWIADAAERKSEVNKWTKL